MVNSFEKLESYFFVIKTENVNLLQDQFSPINFKRAFNCRNKNGQYIGLRAYECVCCLNDADLIRKSNLIIEEI